MIDIKEGDKVIIVYGKNADCYKGYVDSITDNHLILHEYVSDIYRTLLIDSIIEITSS